MAAVLPRVGIVGGPEYILLLCPLLKTEGFPVTAVWCKNHNTSQRLADKFSVPHCPTSFQDLLVLRDVDLVYVASEPLLQAEVAVKAITSGKHCVCVKPPSISLKEVEKMLTLSQYYSQLHTVLECPLEFVPGYLKLRQIITEGGIGNVTTIDVHLDTDSLIGNEMYSWKCDPSLGGGVLNLIGSHIVGLVCNLDTHFCEVKRLNCVLKTFNRTSKKINGYRSNLSDDYCNLQLELMNNTYANIVINSLCSTHYSYQLSVNGTNGRLIMRGLDLYMQQPNKEEVVIYQETLSAIDTQWLTEEPQETTMSMEHNRALLVGSRGMVASLRKLFAGDHAASTLGLSTFKHGYHVRTVLDLARISSTERRWVDVPLAERHVLLTNPFWTTSVVKIDVEKPSPKSHDPVTYV